LFFLEINVPCMSGAAQPSLRGCKRPARAAAMHVARHAIAKQITLKGNVMRYLRAYEILNNCAHT
jgi:hypothetical protein